MTVELWFKMEVIMSLFGLFYFTSHADADADAEALLFWMSQETRGHLPSGIPPFQSPLT